MLKVALVGVGGISGAHIPAWESMKDAELVALCDIRPEQMKKYPNKRRYTDFDEMLANNKRFKAGVSDETDTETKLYHIKEVQK